MKIAIIYYTYEMNIKTNLPGEYVKFSDSTKKQYKYFKILENLFEDILCLFLYLFFFYI